MNELNTTEESKLHWAIRLRKKLLINGNWKWNAWVRDITAWLEYNSKEAKQRRLKRFFNTLDDMNKWTIEHEKELNKWRNYDIKRNR